MPRKKREERPNKLITLDTETLGFTGAIKRIAVYDGIETTYGYTFGDIEWKIIEWYNKGFMPHCYIHNLDFDLKKMPEIFNRENVNWGETLLINRRYAKVTCKSYVLHDSFKLLPMSLDYLTRSFQLTHGKMDLEKAIAEAYPNQYKDKGDFFMRCDPDDPIYIEYLGYDVISLYELIEKLIDVSGITFDDLVKCVSTASMSKYILKNGYKGQLFKNPDSDKTDYEYLISCKSWSSDKPIRATNSKDPISYQQIEEKIRDGYCGGRVEVFTPHLKPYHEKVVGYHYDVNSLYPYAMHMDDEPLTKELGFEKAMFPIGYPSFTVGHRMVKIEFEHWQKVRNGLGFIKAHVYIPDQTVPPLPFKMGRLAFITGHGVGTWTYNELEYAMKYCGVQVIEYFEMIHFKRTYPIFHNFIDLFSKIKTQAKENGEGALLLLSKLLQNTAYGWTGMTREDKTELKDISKFTRYAGRTVAKDDELGFIEISADVRSETIQVQVAAYVTSYARLVLLSMLRKQAEKGQIYYCDTDSIVCSKPLDKIAIHKSKLGYWDLEGEIKEAVFILPKVYSERTLDHENIKFKGVTRETQKTLDFSYFLWLLEQYKEGKTTRINLEKNRLQMRSLYYTQKNNLDPNYFEYRDKDLHLDNKPKRMTDYVNNKTAAWYMETLEDFYTFDFSENLDRFKMPNGDLLDALAEE